ncbi:MAG: polysaccharide biosynthesis protein [Bacteroidaceae bacterium]|nr:polysaccharide biosynthesis protein [Bacteroidaceae bacterium]
MAHLLNRVSDWYFSKASLPYWAVLTIDCLIVLAANTTAYMCNYDVFAHGTFGTVFGTLVIYLAAYIAGFRMMRTYAGVIRFSGFIDLLRIGAALTIALIIITIVRYVADIDSLLIQIGNKVLVEGWFLSLILMWTMRILVKSLFDNYFRTAGRQNVFVYGVKDGGAAIAKSIRNTKPARYNLKGFFTDEPKEAGKEMMAKKIYMMDDYAVTLMQQCHVSALLVSPLKNNEFRKRPKLQEAILEAGIKIYMMPTIQEWTSMMESKDKQLKEVDIIDLLPREEIEVDMDAIGNLLQDKTIMITGSAGSIGSEMVRQIATFKPRNLILIDQAETPQHDIRLMMARQFPDIEAHTIVTSICNATHMEELFRTYRPEYVFHAAAYKHVPMMEDNPGIAIQNNVRGTQVMAELAVKYGVRKFVMISTDKAVNPTNVMGCSKRICEIDVQSLDAAVKRGEVTMENGEKAVTQFVTTRFGNVLGSNGSVIPLFKEQIKNGGPVTVTHKDIVRYFMLIPEACKLVLEAGTMGKGGEIFVFDMGEPVRIADLAKRMIALSGAKNVEIKFTGLRDGEKLYEEVLNDKENTTATPHPKIMVAKVRQYERKEVAEQLEKLYQLSFTFDDMEVVRMMKQMVPEFKSMQSKYEALDK